MSSCYGDRWSNSFGIPLHAKQKLCYARWDWLPQRDEIEYHRWSVIRWITLR
jgi:hypothetical protein